MREKENAAGTDARDFIIRLSPEADEDRHLGYGEALAIVAASSADYLVPYMATMAAGLVSVCVNPGLPRKTLAHGMIDPAVKLP